MSSTLTREVSARVEEIRSAYADPRTAGRGAVRYLLAVIDRLSAAPSQAEEEGARRGDLLGLADEWEDFARRCRQSAAASPRDAQAVAMQHGHANAKDECARALRDHLMGTADKGKL